MRRVTTRLTFVFFPFSVAGLVAKSPKITPLTDFAGAPPPFMVSTGTMRRRSTAFRRAPPGGGRKDNLFFGLNPTSTSIFLTPFFPPFVHPHPLGVALSHNGFLPSSPCIPCFRTLPYPLFPAPFPADKSIVRGFAL